MGSLKLAVVIGATGGQGGSVVSALLKDGSEQFLEQAYRTFANTLLEYKVRAITRTPSSEKGKALAAQDNVEVVAADLDSESSLVKAFSGAHVIFGVTDFFATFGQPDKGAEEAMDVEYTQGTNIAKAAAKTSTLEHFIWSTLPDSRKISNGEYVVPHFDAKVKVDEFIRQDKELLAKTTFLLVTFYASNLFYPPLGFRTAE